MGKTSKLIICDSNVFFDYFKGVPETVSQIRAIGKGNLYLATVTVGEIYYGMDKSDRRRTVEEINKLGLLVMDKAASLMFVKLMSGCHGLGLDVPDGLIAAIALTNKCQLFTYNHKDFAFIRGIKLYNPV